MYRIKRNYYSSIIKTSFFPFLCIIYLIVKNILLSLLDLKELESIQIRSFLILRPRRFLSNESRLSFRRVIFRIQKTCGSSVIFRAKQGDYFRRLRTTVNRRAHLAVAALETWELRVKYKLWGATPSRSGLPTSSRPPQMQVISSSIQVTRHNTYACKRVHTRTRYQPYLSTGPNGVSRCVCIRVSTMRTRYSSHERTKQGDRGIYTHTHATTNTNTVRNWCRYGALLFNTVSYTCTKQND